MGSSTGRFWRITTGIISFLLLLVLALPSIIAAEELSIEYRFDRPQIVEKMIGSKEYQRIIMPNTANSGKAGQPSLPARGAQILLPYGTEVESIEIITGEKVFMGDGYLIAPISKQFPLSADPATITPPTPDPGIYSSGNTYPEVKYENIGTYGFRGYQMLVLKLQPMEYIPTTGELYYYSSLEIVVKTVETGKLSESFRGLEEDETEILSRVDNPEQAYSYRSAPKRGEKNYDLLIITNSLMVSAFQPLKDYHDSTGIMTEIHTTTDIGSAAPDDIKAYIYERYINDGISYVIIGADDNLISAKDLYVQTSSGGSTEYEMPGDLYFVCFDGTWNYDGDSRWGEPTDGDGGGDVDLIHEVYIGRASVDNAAEATRFVDKTIQYITSSDPYIQKVLMVGEYLGFGGEAEYGALAMDRNVDSCSAYGYSTIGIPSNQYDIDRLYERDWLGNDWPQLEIINRINADVHVVNHLGHGSPDYAMKLYNSNVLSSINNDNHCLVYSQTCLAGHFDGTECWAETMNIKIDGGAFAVVMNARNGYGEWNSTDGPSQRFNREFWDAIFNPAEAKPQLGRANADSKEDNIWRINDDCMRWCYYEINLFGDPTVSFKGVRTLGFNFPNGIPTQLEPAVPTTFEVEVYAVGEGVPVSGSGQFHYSINGAAIQDVYMTETLPNTYQASIPGVGCDDVIEFYVSAEEQEKGRIFSPDPSQPVIPTIATEITTVMDIDFEISVGWTVSGNATLGLWERGDPVGGGDRGDPSDDFDGSGQCYLTGNTDGDSDIDNGTTSLTTTIFDLGMNNAEIHYARWFSNNSGGAPNADVMEVFISNDSGANWTLVETVGPDDGESSGGWFEHSFWVTDFITPTSQMMIRFDASDISTGSVVEAGLDDFQITIFDCYDGPLMVTTETLPEWTAGVPYSCQLYCVGGTGNITWIDKYNDLDGTGLSISTNGLLSGTPIISGTISFTAGISDEGVEECEKPLSILINPAVTISTAAVPDGEEAVEYAFQFEATGGFGPCTWSDLNNDLDGTGLTLSSEGLLSGTPTIAMEVTFTVVAEDDIGSSDDQLFSLNIALPYICGDANDDEEVNVSDAVMIINYIFISGEAPNPLEAGDATCDIIVNVSDAVWIINYVFIEGSPAPCDCEKALAK
jgi:Peptidase family C25/Propeptide_C25/Dockerin type I domain/Putative Ig domain